MDVFGGGFPMGLCGRSDESKLPHKFLEGVAMRFQPRCGNGRISQHPVQVYHTPAYPYDALRDHPPPSRKATRVGHPDPNARLVDAMMKRSSAPLRNVISNPRLLPYTTIAENNNDFLHGPLREYSQFSEPRRGRSLSPRSATRSSSPYRIHSEQPAREILGGMEYDLWRRRRIMRPEKDDANNSFPVGCPPWWSHDEAGGNDGFRDSVKDMYMRSDSRAVGKRVGCWFDGVDLDDIMNDEDEHNLSRRPSEFYTGGREARDRNRAVQERLSAVTEREFKVEDRDMLEVFGVQKTKRKLAKSAAESASTFDRNLFYLRAHHYKRLERLVNQIPMKDEKFNFPIRPPHDEPGGRAMQHSKSMRSSASSCSSTRVSSCRSSVNAPHFPPPKRRDPTPFHFDSDHDSEPPKLGILPGQQRSVRFEDAPSDDDYEA